MVFSYDLGNGLRVERGGEVIAKWSRMKEHPQMPRAPKEAVDVITHYLRYTTNLARLGQGRIQVGVLLRSADLIIPASPYNAADINAMASLIRDWASDGAIADQAVATFLMADGCEYLTGQTIAIDGAQYLSGGGTFSQLSKMSDDDWAEIRDMIKKTNDSDKQKRTT